MSTNKKHILLSVAFFSLLIANFSYAASEELLKISRTHPFYMGGLLGYGTTTWRYLIAKDVFTATPINVQEGGFAGGLFLGYEISPYFAFEGLYVHFPTATVDFSPYSEYPVFDDLVGIQSKSDAFSLSGKFLAPIANTKFRGYGLVGVGLAHRSDPLAKTHNIFAPVFGTGLNYSYNEHLMTELGFTYYSGHAKSEMRVAEDFMPFLYTFHMTFSYRI